MIFHCRFSNFFSAQHVSETQNWRKNLLQTNIVTTNHWLTKFFHLQDGTTSSPLVLWSISSLLSFWSFTSFNGGVAIVEVAAKASFPPASKARPQWPPAWTETEVGKNLGTEVPTTIGATLPSNLTKTKTSMCHSTITIVPVMRKCSENHFLITNREQELTYFLF